ncbi:MAG: hypothetical protein RR543_01780 [Erysipelotrichales bacterium]
MKKKRMFSKGNIIKYLIVILFTFGISLFTIYHDSTALDVDKGTNEVETKVKDQDDKRQLEDLENKEVHANKKTNSKVINKERSFPNGNFKGDFSLEANKDSIESGEVATFDMYFKITGSSTNFKNAKIVVELPDWNYIVFDQELKDLDINGVTPTYKGNKLTWSFDSIQGGTMDKHILKIKTLNGLTPNDTALKIKGTFSADNLVDGNDVPCIVNEEASINVKSNGKIALTNHFTNVKDTELVAPSQGETGIWDFSFSVPKLNTGSKLIKENSDIKIKYKLDSLLEYKGVYGSTPTPTNVSTDSSGSTVLEWEFKAPTKQEQVDALNNFFEQNFQIEIFFPTTIPQYQLVTNTLETSANFFDESTIKSDSLNASITVLLSDPDSISSNGVAWAISGRSPSNDVGGTTNDNPDVKVYDDALLGFGLYATMGYGDNPLYGPTQYHLIYEVDDHLDINRFYSGTFKFRPNSNFPSGIPLKEEVIYDVYVKYGTKANQDSEYSLLLEDVTPDKWYLNIDTKGKHISEIELRFHTASMNPWNQPSTPAGMYGYNILFYFNPQKDYVGRVVNNIKNVEMKTPWDAEGYLRPDYGIDTDWSDKITQFWGPFSAQIMARPTGETKVAQTFASFSNVDGNLINVGDNSINVKIASNAASISNLISPFESYVLLPYGVTYNESTLPPSGGSIQKISDNHNKTGRQLIKVTWHNSSIAPNKSISANIKVSVTTKVSSNIRVDVYSFLGNQDFIVPDIVGTPNLTDSYKINDKDDLNENGNKEEYIVKSGNSYLANSKTNLNVDQSLSSDGKKYDRFVEAEPNSIVNYKISLKNTNDETISKLVLVDALPSLNDQSITTHEARDSKYELKLTGPISIPDKWKGKVDIQYSTTATPKVVGILDKYTNYPQNAEHLTDCTQAQDATWVDEKDVSDFSKVRSFKIEVKDSGLILPGRSIDLKFNMLTPGESEIDPSLMDTSIAKEERAANNSFAIAANNSQVVETYKVGVSLKAKESKPNEKPEQMPEEHVNKPIAKAGQSYSLILLISSLSLGLGLAYLQKRNK